MAKITAYKFVNPGVVGTSKEPAVRATSAQLLATNRVGASVEGLANVIADINQNNLVITNFFKTQSEISKKNLRLERDRAAEQKQEKAKLRLASYRDKRAEKNKEDLDKTDDVKKDGEGFLGWADSFFAPFVNIFKDIAAIMIAKGVTDFLKDETKQKEIQDFFRKTFEVGEVIYNFFDGQVKGFLDGWKKLNDPNGDFLTKLGGLGDMLKGIVLLKYLMNPFSLIDDIFSIIDGIGTFFNKKAKGQLDLDGKPKKTDAQLKKMGLNDDQIKAYRKAREGGATAAQALQQAKKVKPKPNIFQRGANVVGGFISDAQKKLMATARSTWGLVSETSQKLYAQLGEAARKQWESMVGLGKRLATKSTQVASSVGNKFGDAAKWVKEGTLKLADDAAKAVQNRILGPVFEFIRPLTDKLKLIAGKIQDVLFGTPLGKQAARALAERGLFPVLDNLGPLTKKLGGKAIPILGGLVNLLFAYDRFQGGDPFGGLLEAISAGFDLAGLVPGGQFGPPISMGIDAYMLARDFVPGIQQGEEALLNMIPGAQEVGNQMKALGNKLPPLSGLLSAIGIGGGPEPEGKAIGGIVNPTPKTNPSTQPGGYAADTGLDIIGKTGDPIVAPVSGTLEYAERGHVAQMGQDSDPRKPGIQDQHSFRIKLDKPFTYAGKKVNFAYGTHLAELHQGVKDKSGIHVKAGTLMGTMGVANNVPHLHLGFVEDRAQNRFLNFKELKALFKGAPSPEVSDTSGMITGTTSSSDTATSQSFIPAMPEFKSPADAAKFMIDELGKLFGAPKKATDDLAAAFDPNVNLNVAPKTTIGNMDFSKIFAMEENLDIVPVSFSVAEPIYLPMPINSGDKTINVFKSPLLSN